MTAARGGDAEWEDSGGPVAGSSGRQQALRPTTAELREEVRHLREQLWFKELADEVATRAEGQLKAVRELSLRRRISSFYSPVLALQGKYESPALLKYAIEETLRAGVCAQPEPWTWHRYAAALCRRQRGSSRTVAGPRGARTLRSRRSIRPSASIST